jgi:ankyrin repeat protein
VVQYLIRNTKDKARYINKVDDYGTTAIHHAALKGDLETLRYLIQKGKNFLRLFGGE